MSSVAKDFQWKIRVSLWLDNEALVRRVQKMIEGDPIAAFKKNDPDVYCRIKDVVQELELMDVSHMHGHPDNVHQTLSTVKNTKYHGQ